MQLSEIKADSLDLSNTVSAQYKDTSLERSINIYYDDIVSFIWSIDGSWSFDEGVDYLPVAEANLVADQADYQIPSDARKIHRVKILDKNGNPKFLKPLTEKTQPEDSTDTGEPSHYKMVGRSIILYPTPDYDYTKGLILQISKSVTQLSNASDEPKIDREFHRYLSYGAAKDWYLRKSNITKKRELENEMEKMKRQIRSFYAQKHRDFDAKIRPIMQNYQ